MGFGDAKLGLSIGLFLGAFETYSALVIAFVVGALVSLVLLAFSRFGALSAGHKKLTIKSEIPFAPFMILGAWVSLIYDLNFFHLIH